MTKQEYNDLYDSIFYGHDAELEMHGKHFFIEWCNKGIDIYLLNNDDGTKIASFSSDDKNELMTNIFSYQFEEQLSLDYSYDKINIVDIE